MQNLPQTDQAKLKKTSFKLSVCKNCGGEGHTKMTCRLLPKSQLKVTKPMNKVGRVAKETAKAVAKWKRKQESNHNGTYNCYICSQPVEYLMAEHVKSKARHPELRTDPKNFKPTCSDCNAKKGSKNG